MRFFSFRCDLEKTKPKNFVLHFAHGDAKQIENGVKNLMWKCFQNIYRITKLSNGCLFVITTIVFHSSLSQRAHILLYRIQFNSLLLFCLSTGTVRPYVSYTYSHLRTSIDLYLKYTYTYTFIHTHSDNVIPLCIQFLHRCEHKRHNFSTKKYISESRQTKLTNNNNNSRSSSSKAKTNRFTAKQTFIYWRSDEEKLFTKVIFRCRCKVVICRRL